LSQPAEVEFTDVDVPATAGRIVDVIQGLLDGKLGLYSVVRHPNDKEWQSCYRTPPFAYVLPHFVQRKQWYKTKLNSLEGSLYVVSDYQKLVTKAKEVLTSGQLNERWILRSTILGQWP